MSARRPSLSAMRERAQALTSESALRRIAGELERDGRRGALALAVRCRRRATSLGKERRRMASLFRLRDELARAGARSVAGVDEVGVGPLAGPVVAAAVVLEDRPVLPRLDDSKKLPREARERLDVEIRRQARSVAVAEVWPEEIDRINIYQASLLAMSRAVAALDPAPDHLLVDARRIPGVELPQTPLVGGDGRDASIAAASIVAKVHRDALMQRLDGEYPGYGFASHKGYATAEHMRALERRGPCPIHRRSYAPVAQARLFAP